jgi:hypothetical protein
MSRLKPILITAAIVVGVLYVVFRINPFSIRQTVVGS